MKTIALQFAMKIEAEPLLKELHAKPIQSLKPQYAFEFYECNFKNLKLIIALAGKAKRFDVDSIGSVPATLLADTLITYFKPDLILNPGTAGGFEAKGAKIAEVYLGGPTVCFHHRRIGLPGMEEMGRGNYPTASFPELAKKLNLKTAIVSSGDSLDYSHEDKIYLEKNEASLKEMEAAAIGWVCEHHHVSFLPIKSITDFVDQPADTGEQFLKNYKAASQSLCDVVLQVLDYFSK